MLKYKIISDKKNTTLPDTDKAGKLELIKELTSYLRDYQVPMTRVIKERLDNCSLSQLKSLHIYIKSLVHQYKLAKQDESFINEQVLIELRDHFNL
ncbi:MAG: hypothetical protein PHV30_09705 [Candidatus Margulisbacteria bacterium]|nr:hypothetical protein [Candidatus Margulisiibacteriota bacterium]